MRLLMFAGGEKVVDGVAGGELPDSYGRPWDGTQESAQAYLTETRNLCHKEGSPSGSWIGWTWYVFIGMTPEDDDERRMFGTEPITAAKPLAMLTD